MGVQSWAPSPCVADGGLQIARRGRVHSTTAPAASTAAAAGRLGESRCGCNRKRGNMSEHSAISRTAASRVHTTWGLFGRAKPRCIIAAACIRLLGYQQWQETSVGNRGLSAAVPKTMGFRPDGIKSSGMAARTSCLSSLLPASCFSYERIITTTVEVFFYFDVACFAEKALGQYH